MKLVGNLKLPGDKSISQRAILIGSVANGRTVIRSAGTGKNIELTVKAMQQIGVDISYAENPAGCPDIIINGKGTSGLKSPDDEINCGGSATLSRMLIGMASGLGIKIIITGNEHLKRRPMKRITDPLKLMGASFTDDTLPITVNPAKLHGITYKMPMASSQVKSGILLAGMLAEGKTKVIEPSVTRDHTERMLKGFGADIKSHFPDNDNPEIYSEINSGKGLTGQEIIIPGDLSSACFFIAAALIIPESDIILENVGFNKTRTGFIDIARMMGGNIICENARISGGEPVCDIHVRYSRLHGINVCGSLISRSIDELPLVAVLGAFANGTTTVSEADELRIKECDRISAMTENLSSLGIDITEKADGWVINGIRNNDRYDMTGIKDAAISSQDDHRIAMCMEVARDALGLPRIKDKCVEASYPAFYDDIDTLIK